MSETFKTELPYHPSPDSPRLDPPPHDTSINSASKYPSIKSSSLDYPHPHHSSTNSIHSLPSSTPSLPTSTTPYQPPIRLPTSVNIIALREAFLSEAPFVTNQNRIYWRRMIDHYNYQNLLAVAFHILLDCISENSIINLYQLYSLQSSSGTGTGNPGTSKNTKYVQYLSINLAELYFNIKLKERDIFFNKLSELLTYMIVNALRTSYPKHHRICQSIKFREILLDWLNELLSGIRNTNCRINCEWLFQDIYDVPILTTTTSSSTQITSASSSTSLSLHNGNGNTSSSSSLTGGAGVAGGTSGKKLNSSYSPSPASSSSPAMANGIVRSKYTISLSPLINLYTGQSLAKKSEVSMNLSLSHSVSRPLTTLSCGNDDTSTVLGRLKGRSLDYDQVKSLIQSSREKRKEILREHKKNIKDANRDIGKYKVRYKKTLKALEQTDRGSILAMYGSNATSGVAGGTQQTNANSNANTGLGAAGTGSALGNSGRILQGSGSGGVGIGSPMRREENVNL